MDPRPKLKKYGLQFNPFPPAASGVAFGEATWLPTEWVDEITEKIDQLSLTGGPKAIAIVGPYGAGKTFLLHWISETQYRPKRIKTFFLGNPGVAFYNLADQLFRQIGRYELSKGMWELLNKDIPNHELQGEFLKREFPVWLDRLRDRRARDVGIRDIQKAIIEQGITQDEEIAFRFGQMMVDTKDRPYYRFQDFVPRSRGTLVAESREGEYFNTLIRVLQRIYDATGIAFLIDEFEDAALGKRLTRKQSADYHATLRNLLDTADEEEFWLTLSSTPQGIEQTRNIEPALMQRFGAEFCIPRLTDQDAYDLAHHRLEYARINKGDYGLWPFEDDVLSCITEANRSWPRGMVKILSQALTLAIREEKDPPIPNSLAKRAEANLQTYRAT